MKLHNIDCDFSTGIINATINRKDTNNLFDEVNKRAKHLLPNCSKLF